MEVKRKKVLQCAMAASATCLGGCDLLTHNNRGHAMAGGFVKTDVVRVLAPARLHLGFLDMNGSLGRTFGGIGLGIAEPRTCLTLCHAEGKTHHITGMEGRRAARYLEAISRQLALPGPFSLHVSQAIPSHAGLGSGTQLALSVAAAVRHLQKLPLDPEGDAARLGRGLRSGLGAGLFRRGGLMVDGGKGNLDAPPPIVSCLPFPSDWRVLLVMDSKDEGIHGTAEVEAFRRLPPFPEADAARICRLTLMQMLPCVAERDIDGFGAAVHEIQRMVGAHFAPAQGGVFTSPRVGAAMAALDAMGAHGTGQSSWGPTGFAFADSEDTAQNLRRGLVGKGLADGLDIRVVAARGGGAVVETVSHGLDGMKHDRMESAR